MRSDKMRNETCLKFRTQQNELIKYSGDTLPFYLTTAVSRTEHILDLKTDLAYSNTASSLLGTSYISIMQL